MQYILTEEEYAEFINTKRISEAAKYNQKYIETFFKTNCIRKRNGYCDDCPLVYTRSIYDERGLCLAGLIKELSK